VIDRMIAVTDAESIGAMRALSAWIGRRVGGSTGTNLWACARIAEEMKRAGQQGSIVTLICDGVIAMAEPIMTTPGWPSAASSGKRQPNRSRIALTLPLCCFDSNRDAQNGMHSGSSRNFCPERLPPTILFSPDSPSPAIDAQRLASPTVSRMLLNQPRC
jgi:hypothetical protein